MDFHKTREDLKYYGERAEYIDKHSNCSSDFWIEYDKPKYYDDPIFNKLICDIQKIDNDYYEKIKSMKGE